MKESMKTPSHTNNNLNIPSKQQSNTQILMEKLVVTNGASMLLDNKPPNEVFMQLPLLTTARYPQLEEFLIILAVAVEHFATHLTDSFQVECKKMWTTII